MEKIPNTTIEPLPSPELLPPPTGERVPDDFVKNIYNLPLNPTEERQEGLLSDTLTSDSKLDEKHQDAGAMDIAPIGKVVDSLRVSYHGARYMISRVRQMRAEDRAQKISRKEAIYSELSGASGARKNLPTKAEYNLMSPVEQKRSNESRKSSYVPESVVERMVSKRQFKKEIKVKGKAANARIVAKGYTGKDNIEGATRADKARTRVAIALSSDGPQEKYIAKQELKAKKTINPNSTQRIVNRQASRAERKHNKTIRQPIAKRWRALRRLNAEDTIAKQQSKAQKHLNKAIDIRN